MGNALRKLPDSIIDGGSTRLRGVGNPTTEYDEDLVKKLISNRRLAPFYKGKTEPSILDDNASISSLSSSSHEEIENQRRGKGLFRLHRGRKEKEDSPVVSQFLRNVQYYPRNINLTFCCNQSICTTCFVSMRRPPSGRTMSCPFCNQRDFSVYYLSPLVLLAEARSNGGGQATRHSRLPQVKCEAIRPYRPPAPPPPPPPSAAYRAATTNYQAYSGPPFSVRNGGGHATTYGGGVLVLYNNQGRRVYIPESSRNLTYSYQRPPSYAYQPSRTTYTTTNYRDQSLW